MTLQDLTTFPDTAESLTFSLREAELDHAAFIQKIKACTLEVCRATCCHDGVYLSEEEAEGVGLLAEKVAALDGMLLPAEPVQSGSGGKRKTCTRPARREEFAHDYPKHFPETRCVFLDDHHRCGLQRLAMEEGRHPWFYKPLTCWIHPILIQNRGWDQRPLVTLPAPETDPQKTPDYPGFASCTHCGRPDQDGVAAAEALAPELKMLSRISGRDLLKELG